MTVTQSSVVKRGRAFAVVVVSGEGQASDRLRSVHSGFPTRAAAEEARLQFLGAVGHIDSPADRDVTVRAFVEGRWLPHLESLATTGTLRVSTVAHYRNQVRWHVLPYVGDEWLGDLTPDRLGRLYAQLSVSGNRKVGGDQTGGLSQASVRHVHITIHRMLRDALRWGAVDSNVADQATLDVPRAGRQKEMSTWTPTQLRIFLDHVRVDDWCALWLLMVTTGLRRGEIAGLRWDALDLDSGRLRVSRTRVVVGFKIVESLPKTAKSAREIALDPETVRILCAHKAASVSRRDEAGSTLGQEDLVFTWADGRPLHPETISSKFHRHAESAGLPRIRLHDLRHSYATAALEAGIPLKVVSQRLGHSSISITGDIYSHVRPELDQSAADQVAGLILGADTPSRSPVPIDRSSGGPETL